jgi:succinate dehydrogenase / fumarate reductase cytochrome b subunit
MKTNKNRPVFLNLTQIHLPAAGIVSVLHRISGVLLVFSLPLFLYLLQLSLSGPHGFEKVHEMLVSPLGRAATLLGVVVFGHHFFAGIRHLFMDLDLGVTRASGRLGAYAVFFVDGLLAVVVGVGLL